MGKKVAAEFVDSEERPVKETLIDFHINAVVTLRDDRLSHE